MKTEKIQHKVNKNKVAVIKQVREVVTRPTSDIPIEKSAQRSDLNEYGYPKAGDDIWAMLVGH